MTKIKKILYLSPIFKWFRSDFEKKKFGFFYMLLFSEPIPKNVKLEFTDYDWTLNEKK